MELVLIALASVGAAGLTFFSGFGLGTLLLPVLALFVSVEVAVALTATVHFLNNLLKLVLLGRHAERRTFVQFGLVAMVGAYGGAQVLLWLANLEPLVEYQLGVMVCRVTPVNVTVALLLIAFTLFEAIPRLQDLSPDSRHLMLGGVLSGFFGGLSGHQGALRSAFLIKCGLTKEQFLGTGVVIACMVDASRLAVYASDFLWQSIRSEAWVLLTAILSAFLGTVIGARLLPRMTLDVVRRIVSVLIVALAVGLGSGIL